MPPPEELAVMLERVRSALVRRDFAALTPVLAENVCFESCVGRSQVVEFLSRVFGDTTLEIVDTESHADRHILTLDLSSERAEPRPGAQRRIAVAFIAGARIIELKVVADRDQALAAERSQPRPRPRTPTKMNTLAPVLPVRDLTAALRHYGGLGFSVREYEGGGYGYAQRDGVSLHLNAVAEVNPATTTSAVYLYVDDADSLYAEWRSAGVSGHFIEPQDTAYGLREGAHIDGDGNLIRFGSPLPAGVQR